ncbi:MAG: ATP-binding cassette domain-containing protein [Gammaproteobacteria bacterium]|nr:ATP-binding cassette domain-containing protein [Gammaproteobacteria bacterium]
MSDSTPGTSVQQTHSDGPLVRLHGVDVTLAGNTVLHDLNWELHAGEHWAIVGANGSGKTSFLRLVAGTLWPAPNSGTRRYDFGRELQIDAVQALSKITLIGHELQDRYTRLGWNFDAVDVVLSGLKRTSIPRHEPAAQDRIRARGMLRKLKLLHLAERPFLELSRGEQRRILIARGLAFKPIILILDEPVAGLDAKSRRALNEMIEQISADITVLCSYHQAANLPRNMNRMLRLADGHVVESGPISATSNAYGDHTNADSTRRESSPPVAASSEITIIDVQRAAVWLDKRRVLADISWRLMDGEHWQLTGPNGAGKSTFLRLLHGQLRPAKGGSIEFPGIDDPDNVWSLRRQVAWVSPELQAGYWYPCTVYQCIASGFESSIGQTRRLKRVEAELVAELLEQFDLADLSKRNVKALSYGQFRRVLIARAVVHRPKVLLLDEPWEGLDSGNLELVTRELNQIIARGTQLVCASHLHQYTEQFNRELVFEHGRIVRAG